MNESQLRAANNDWMDPYWKPDIKPEKIEAIDNIKNLYYVALEISELFKNTDLSDESKGYSVTLGNAKWAKLRSSVLAIKGN